MALAPLLNARSVAIVGAGQLPGFGGRIYANLRDFGYPGPVYAVNPRYTSLFDQPCYASLSQLPERPECAVLAVPNQRLLPVFAEAASLGIPAAVVFASAYSEPVPGEPPLQTQVARLARESGMALCGPNCMGFLAFGQKLVVSGYPVTPGTPAGSVTFITHSGSVFDSVWQNRSGVHFNYVISSGNEIATTMADYIRFALADPSTRAIGLFMETVRDPEGFTAALAEAAQRDIPIVAVKVGRSPRGAELAQVHSGALAGEDAVYDAVFAHYGVRRARSLDELIDTLQLFSAGLRPPTRFITSIHDSGGERGLLVDLADSEGVPFAAIDSATTARLAGILEPGLAPVNPVDAWGTGNEIDRIYRDCLLALDADPANGLTLFAVDLYPAGTIGQTYADVAIAALPNLQKPLAFLANVTSAAAEAHCSRLRQAGIPVLMGTETGLRAVRHLLDYGEQRRQSASASPEAPAASPPPEELARWRSRLSAASGPLDEFESKQLLRAYGLPVPVEEIASSLDEARRAAARIGYPVALKTAAPGVLHKSDRGGVHLKLRDAAGLEQAYRRLDETFGPRVLVQAMAPEGVELILGLVRDPQFGLLLTIGTGGILVEMLQDARLVLAGRGVRVTRAAVRAALLSLQGAPLLQGVRGRPPADLEAVVDAALRLAALGQDLGDHLSALEINPLIVLPSQVIAVDALTVPA